MNSEVVEYYAYLVGECLVLSGAAVIVVFAVEAVWLDLKKLWRDR